MSKEQYNGSHPYQGYEYQILASVWVALELILRHKSSLAIVVEPASGEDIAVDLNVDPEEAGCTLQARHELEHIEIQVKFRQSGHWTPSEFKNVVQGSEKRGTRGPEKRIRPIGFLRSSPNTKFTLLTNAQVIGKLRPYLIEEFGKLSASSTIPGEPDAVDGPEVSPRIGILQQRETERLVLEIDQILRREGHVPLGRCESCLKILKEAVRMRLLGQSESTWTQEEIIAAIQEAGGFPVIERYHLVKPSNYDQILRQISEKYKLVICGPPGTGKTFLAEHIANIHRLDDDPFEVVTEEEGITGIKKRLDRNQNFLFLLNDPWGLYKLAEDADRWTSELPKLLQKAGSHKRFIITSRIGIKKQAIKDHESSELGLAEILLAQDHYGSEKLIEILEFAMKDSKSWQQDLVKRYHSLITDKLKVPYSLVVFANKVSNSPSEQVVDIEELISQSNIEAIGSNLAREIAAMGEEAIASAVVLWALMMSYPFIRTEYAGVARKIIRSAGYQRALDPQKLFRWLLDAKWIQPKSKGFTAHPTVLEGLESLIDYEPAITEDVLLALLNGLVAKVKVAVAHKIIKQLKGRNLPIPEVVHKAINLYLLDRLKTASGYQFNEAFREVGQWSTGADPVSTLVRILSKRKKVKYVSGRYKWQRPELSNYQIENIASSETARECASMFIQEILPSGFSGDAYNASDLVSFFNSLGWDMSESFLIAAETALKKGNPVLEVLVEGALSDHPVHSERLLRAALTALDDANEWLDGFHTEYRRADQAELDAEHANHVMEQPSERFYPINTALKAIVSSRRKVEGYKWLEEHARILDFLESWIENVDESTSADEVRAILRVCPASDRRPVWKAIQKARLFEFVTEVIQCLEASPVEHIERCLEVLSDLLTLDQWKDYVIPSVQSLSFVRRAVIWLAAKGFDERFIEDASKIVQLIESTLTPTEALCLSLCYRVSDENSNSLPISDENVKVLLREIADTAPDHLSIRAVFVLAKMNETFANCLPTLLKCENTNIRVNAIRLAATLPNESGKSLLQASLGDQDYHCRREAMWLLSEIATEEDKMSIMEKASDPSAPVREACANLVGRYRWVEAQSRLLELLNDDRDASQDHIFRFHIPNYHVARAAALSLAKLGELSQSSIDLIMKFIRKRDPKNDDLIIHYHLLDVLALQYSHRVLLFLEGFLDDIWHMSGIKLEGFPLRYAAAWGIFQQFMEDASLMEIIPIDRIYKGAVHTDSRLASPCLLCLGLLGERAQSKIIQALRAESMNRERALFILGTLPDGCKYTKDRLIEFIGPSHPALIIFEMAKNSPSISEEDWKCFLAENVSVAKWLDSIQSSEDVNPVLRFVLYILFDEPVCNHFSNLEDFRKHELAESIPIMTLRSMFGGE